MMEEIEQMEQELSEDEEFEALVALIEERVIEKLALMFERLALERDGGG